MHCSSRPWQRRRRFGGGGEILGGGGCRDGGDAALGGGGRDSRGAAAEILGPAATGTAGTPTAVPAKHAGGGGGEARRRRSTPAARTAMSGWGTGGASEQRAGSSQPVSPDRSLPRAWPRHSERWVLFVSLPVKTWSILYLRSLLFLAPKVVRISKF
jgi:hypothetical protein